jgi:hypothetical protein
MTKKNIIIISLSVVFLACHWLFGTKVFTSYSYPIFDKQHWYAEMVRVWIGEEDKARLRVWKDTIPVFMNDRDANLPNINGFTIISLNPRSALWNTYRNKRVCQIIQEKDFHNPFKREIKLRIRDNFDPDTSKFNFTNFSIAKPRDWKFVLLGARYRWFIAEHSRPTGK